MSTYIPDFYIPEFGLIELKSTKRDKVDSYNNCSKYKCAYDIYSNLNIKYDMYSLEEALQLIHFKKELYELKALAKNEILNNLDGVHVWCKSYSVIGRNIFEDTFNKDNPNLTLM